MLGMLVYLAVGFIDNRHPLLLLPFVLVDHFPRDC